MLLPNLLHFIITRFFALLPEAMKQWSLSTLRERLIKLGARIVRHGRSVIFQMAELAVTRALSRPGYD